MLIKAVLGTCWGVWPLSCGHLFTLNSESEVAARSGRSCMAQRTLTSELKLINGIWQLLQLKRIALCINMKRAL